LSIYNKSKKSSKLSVVGKRVSQGVRGVILF
jgi:hypothetical protein